MGKDDKIRKSLEENDGYIIADESVGDGDFAGVSSITASPFHMQSPNERIYDNTFGAFYLNIRLEKDGIMPTRANEADAGCDVYAPHKYHIRPHQDMLIPLRWRCEFPNGYVMKFWNKSGVCTKKKLIVGASVVDAGYRGIVHCHLINTSDQVVQIDQGQKIAQFIMSQCWHGQPTQVSEIDMDTDRGEGGFGSSGE
jgi:dUTP pyrophosphatase